MQVRKSIYIFLSKPNDRTTNQREIRT